MNRTSQLQSFALEQTRPSDGYVRRSLRAFGSRAGNWLVLAIILLGVLMALVPVDRLPYDPTQVALRDRLLPPDRSFQPGGHPLGTDVLGRDILSRSIYAARWTLLVPLSAAAISMVLSTLAGLTSGYSRGRVDGVIARLIDMQLAFPAVLISVSVLAVAGPSLLNTILVLGLIDWAYGARLIRSATINVAQAEYISAARGIGVTDLQIVARHIMPNVLSAIFILASFSIARLILAESALSFLGLGVPPPAATWGGMIGSGRDHLATAWWITAVPGFLVTITVLAFNMLGDSLRDAFDPRQTRG